MDRSLVGLLLCPCILSRLRYPTLFQLALWLLSPIQRYALAVGGNLFFGMFVTSYCHFNFLTSLFVLYGPTFPILLLNTDVLLVVLLLSTLVLFLLLPSVVLPAASQALRSLPIRVHIQALVRSHSSEYVL